ncbi:MAG: phosphoribosylformylglycinamidine synthase subunit PurL [Rickettsiales bacterium]
MSDYTPVIPDNAPIGEEAAHLHNLSVQEYSVACNALGRRPNLTEIGIFSAMWSEHCSYKSTRNHLSKLPTKAPWVICGPGENAGVIDIEDGDAAIFKMESHNHPSFIEPYQGAATGVGGILRDVFTMGARPVANLNALRFGALDHEKTPYLLSGVVAGIGGYGNCVGVPTVGGECGFHPAYNGNILVNAMNVGVAKADRIFYSAAAAVGAPVIYFGAKTGRDGINGAVMASGIFGEDSAAKRPTVQVGDPFMEKLVLEACLELMREDAILAIQDMGAAGLTCSSLEMADKGGTGIHLQLDKVPLREKGMTPYEIMLSESQERMLTVLKPGSEEIAARIFNKWEVPWAVVGSITDTGRIVLTIGETVVADMQVKPLSEQAPRYDRPYVIKNSSREIRPGDVTPPAPLSDVLLRLMATPENCAKRWIAEQYDSQVMGDTIYNSGKADAALVRVHGTKKALAMTTDCTPRYCKADPKRGGAQAVAETYRNICATGATPLAITNCLNFGNPEIPEIMGQLVGCLEGMAEACRALDYPVVSGNVSLYNSTGDEAILPTPAIGGVGLLRDLSKRLDMAFKKEGNLIALVGAPGDGHLGCSLYMRELFGDEDAVPPLPRLTDEKRNGAFIRDAIGKGLLEAAHDVSDGGVACAVADMALAGNIGAMITEACGLPEHAFCFGEDQARYVVEISEENVKTVSQLAESHHAPLAFIGLAEGAAVTLFGHETSLAALRAATENVIPGLFAGRAERAAFSVRT